MHFEHLGNHGQSYFIFRFCLFLFRFYNRILGPPNHSVQNRPISVIFKNSPLWDKIQCVTQKTGGDTKGGKISQPAHPEGNDPIKLCGDVLLLLLLREGRLPAGPHLLWVMCFMAAAAPTSDCGTGTWSVEFCSLVLVGATKKRPSSSRFLNKGFDLCASHSRFSWMRDTLCEILKGGRGAFQLEFLWVTWILRIFWRVSSKQIKISEKNNRNSRNLNLLN